MKSLLTNCEHPGECLKMSFDCKKNFTQGIFMIYFYLSKDRQDEKYETIYKDSNADIKKKLAQPVDFRSNLSDFFCRGINERFEFCYENLSEKAGL